MMFHLQAGIYAWVELYQSLWLLQVGHCIIFENVHLRATSMGIHILCRWHV